MKKWSIIIAFLVSFSQPLFADPNVSEIACNVVNTAFEGGPYSLLTYIQSFQGNVYGTRLCKDKITFKNTLNQINVTDSMYLTTALPTDTSEKSDPSDGGNGDSDGDGLNFLFDGSGAGNGQIILNSTALDVEECVFELNVKYSHFKNVRIRVKRFAQAFCGSKVDDNTYHNVVVEATECPNQGDLNFPEDGDIEFDDNGCLIEEEPELPSGDGENPVEDFEPETPSGDDQGGTGPSISPAIIDWITNWKNPVVINPEVFVVPEIVIPGNFGDGNNGDNGNNGQNGDQEPQDPNAPTADSDGDGVINANDNCPQEPNPDQADANQDGLGNVCDPLFQAEDTDADGVDNDVDNCTLEANPDQNDVDADGLGDLCDPDFIADESDMDGDGVEDAEDNCVNIPNSSQIDSDADGAGDACDIDTNLDYVGEGPGVDLGTGVDLGGSDNADSNAEASCTLNALASPSSLQAFLSAILFFLPLLVLRRKV